MKLTLAFLCLIAALFAVQFDSRQDPWRGWLGPLLALAFIACAFALSPGGCTT